MKKVQASLKEFLTHEKNVLSAYPVHHRVVLKKRVLQQRQVRPTFAYFLLQTEKQRKNLIYCEVQGQVVQI